MAIDVNAAEQGENQRQGGQAKDLKVDPNVLRQPEGNVDIGKTAKNKEHRPGDIQSGPDLLRQRQLFTQHALDKRFFHNPLAD